MSASTIRLLVVGAFALHGAGMVGAAGYLPWSIRRGDFVGASWLVGNGTLAIAVGIAVWGVAGLGFLAAAAGYWQAADWWRLAAWVGSTFTLVAIGLWFGNVPVGVYAGGVLALGTIGYLVLA